MEGDDMTEEDKQLIAVYIGWNIVMVGPQKSPYPIYVDNIDSNIHHRFDLNDAALCVQEMQKRGEWEQFHDFVIEWGDLLSKASFAYITAWLMSMEEGQAKNFFKAFVEWRKGK